MYFMKRAMSLREVPRFPGSDTTAEAYILESIVNPDAHIVEGFSHGVMPPNFGHRLSQQQLADLTAFMMTQE